MKNISAWAIRHPVTPGVLCVVLLFMRSAGTPEPSVHRLDIDGNEIVAYAVSSSTLSDEDLSWFVDNAVSKRLLAVAGVSQVSRGGGVSREIRVELDPARMQALGVTAAQ